MDYLGLGLPAVSLRTSSRHRRLLPSILGHRVRLSISFQGLAALASFTRSGPYWHVCLWVISSYNSICQAASRMLFGTLEAVHSRKASGLEAFYLFMALSAARTLPAVRALVGEP
jgi:hypothetical protein